MRHEIAARADVESLTGIVHSDGELPAADLSVRDRPHVARRAVPGVRDSRSRSSTANFTVADARIVGGRHLKLQLRASSRCRRGAARAAALDAIAFGYLGGAMEDPSLALRASR